MDDTTQIFIFASSEVEQLLADYETDLVSLLKKQNIDVDYGFASDPSNTGLSEKSVPKVIAATAALSLSLTPILSQVIQSIAPKGIITHEVVCVPVQDSQGNIIRDASDQPILQWVRKDKFQEYRQINTDSQILIKGFGIEIKYSNPSEK